MNLGLGDPIPRKRVNEPARVIASENPVAGKRTKASGLAKSPDACDRFLYVAPSPKPAGGCLRVSPAPIKIKTPNPLDNLPLAPYIVSTSDNSSYRK